MKRALRVNDEWTVVDVLLGAEKELDQVQSDVLLQMNNFQLILNNEQSMSFQWCFSMDSDSVYKAVQNVFKAEFNEAFCTFCLP